MKMRTLTAIKPHKYGTRHLVAGDEYEVPPRHAVALVAGRKAKFAHKPVRAAKIDAQLVHESDDSIAGAATPEVSIDSLRMDATQLGIDIDGRWGLARLQYEIGRAKS
jgi:hypothetical protein